MRNESKWMKSHKRIRVSSYTPTLSHKTIKTHTVEEEDAEDVVLTEEDDVVDGIIPVF